MTKGIDMNFINDRRRAAGRASLSVRQAQRLMRNSPLHHFSPEMTRYLINCYAGEGPAPSPLAAHQTPSPSSEPDPSDQNVTPGGRGQPAPLTLALLPAERAAGLDKGWDPNIKIVDRGKIPKGDDQ